MGICGDFPVRQDVEKQVKRKRVKCDVEKLEEKDDNKYVIEELVNKSETTKVQDIRQPSEIYPHDKDSYSIGMYNQLPIHNDITQENDVEKYELNEEEQPSDDSIKIKVSKGVNTIDGNEYDTINIKETFKKNDFTRYYSTCDKYIDKKYVKTYDLISLKRAGRKIVGVLFSNGLDSTYRIIEELNKGNIVVPITNVFNDDYDLYNIGILTIEMLANMYPKSLHKVVKMIDIKFSENVNFADSFKYTQQFVNPYCISLIDLKILGLLDEIHYSLVLEDQGISYIDDIRNVYKLGFNFNLDYIKNKLEIPELKFDMIKYDKVYLYEKYKYIFDQLPIVSCQNANVSYFTNKKKDKFYIHICMDNKCHSCDINSNLKLNSLNNSIFIEINKFNEKRIICKKEYENDITAEAMEI